jgi:lactoylglutathione lyase
MLQLMVIRTPDMQALHEFYKRLGFHFDYHQHGPSLPYHYSTTIGALVFEIYPLAKGQTEADQHLRLGFEIERFDDVIAELKQEAVPFISEAIQTHFGFMAVVQDPDGRKVALYKK